MLKKMIILGVAGVLAAGFGVAGCSGSSNVVDGTETAKVEDVTETVGQVEESTVAEVETSFSEAETEATVQEKEGKYVYEILGGKLKVPLNTKVEDYIVPRRALDIGPEYPDDLMFDVLRLATDLGWEPSHFRQDVDFPEKRPDEYTYHKSNGESIYVEGIGNLTSDGRLTADDYNPSCGFSFGGTERGANVTSLKFCTGPLGLEYVEQCEYGSTFDGAVSYDYIVLFTYLLENVNECTYSASGTPFARLLENNGIAPESLAGLNSFDIFNLY